MEHIESDQTEKFDSSKPLLSRLANGIHLETGPANRHKESSYFRPALQDTNRCCYCRENTPRLDPGSQIDLLQRLSRKQGLLFLKPTIVE